MNGRRNWFLALTLVGAVVFAAAPARAITIDFDTFAADGDGLFNDDTFSGQIFDNEYQNQIPGAPAGLGMTVSAQNAAPTGFDLAVIFDTENPSGGDTDLAQPFQQLANPSLGFGSGLGPLGEQNPRRIIILQEHNSGSCTGTQCTPADDEGGQPAGIIIIAFNRAVTATGADFFDIEQLENGTTNDNAIRFFDAEVGGTEIPGSVQHTPFTGGDWTWDRLTYNVEGVRRIEIHMGGSGGIDNITIKVPEPGTLAVFAFGLAGLGFMRRRRRNA
jgi:hypothetical protein